MREVLFVGSEIGLERDLVPESGYDIELIAADGFDRQHLLRNIKVMRTLRRGAKKSRKIIKEFRPDVVIGTGGYASAPVMKEAQKLHIPTYIHEQNAVAGMANRLLEKGVNKLFSRLSRKHPEYFRYPGEACAWPAILCRHVFIDCGQGESESGARRLMPVGFRGAGISAEARGRGV